MPAAFAGSIALAAHHKAADYTVAKQHLGVLETLVDALVLIAMTLGGGLALLLRCDGGAVGRAAVARRRCCSPASR